eukprot:6174521-Pleurochrysis_carterae.AAC.11
MASSASSSWRSQPRGDRCSGIAPLTECSPPSAAFVWRDETDTACGRPSQSSSPSTRLCRSDSERLFSSSAESDRPSSEANWHRYGLICKRSKARRKARITSCAEGK